MQQKTLMLVDPLKICILIIINVNSIVVADGKDMVKMLSFFLLVWKNVQCKAFSQ